MLKNKGPLITRNWARTLVIIIAVLMAGLPGGCSKGAVKQELIKFQFRPDKTINDERPVYVLVRKVNKKEFLTESYNAVADTVFANPPDESVLERLTLFPGQNEKIQVAKPDRSDLGVYVLFSRPSDQWRLLLEKPLKSKYRINLKDNELFEDRRGLFW